MKRISTSFCAVLALSFGLSGAAPTMAAPLVVPAAPVAPAVQSDVVQVQSRRHRGNDRRHRFERRGNRAYYRGHRGYRDRRAGYRQHNGWWFPPAAFALGAIVGGAINQQPTYRLSNAHVAWCHNRWRSYRVSDNSYQPYNGPRRICVSPYS